MMFSQRIDFGRSRIFWNHGSHKSHGSFRVEAVLRIYDANDDVEELFALGAGAVDFDKRTDSKNYPNFRQRRKDFFRART